MRMEETSGRRVVGVELKTVRLFWSRIECVPGRSGVYEWGKD